MSELTLNAAKLTAFVVTVRASDVQGRTFSECCVYAVETRHEAYMKAVNKALVHVPHAHRLKVVTQPAPSRGW